MYNEVIISNYDGMFAFKVLIDGVAINREEARNIVYEIEQIDYTIYPNNNCRCEAFEAFAKKLNCKRLIYCDCGGIEIYEP